MQELDHVEWLTRALVASLDRRRRLIELIPVAAEDENLPELAGVLANAPENIRAVVLFTYRAELASTTPVDQQRWEAMQTAVAGSHVVLLDWFVLSAGRWAWSVAEHADTPAQW